MGKFKAHIKQLKQHSSLLHGGGRIKRVVPEKIKKAAGTMVKASLLKTSPDHFIFGLKYQMGQTKT